MLFCSTGSQDHGGPGVAKHMSCLNEFCFGNTDNALDLLRPVGSNPSSDLFKAFSSGVNIVLVNKTFTNKNMEQTISQGSIRTRGQVQMKMGVTGSGRSTRVYYDQFATVVTLSFEVLHKWRHGLCDVAAYQQNDFGVGDIFYGEGQAAIHAKGANGSSSGGRHAETAIIVDL